MKPLISVKGTTKMKPLKNPIIGALIATLPGVAGLFALLKLTDSLRLSTGLVLSIVVVILDFVIYSAVFTRMNIFEKMHKRKTVFSAVFAFLFALSFFLGYQMRFFAMTTPGFAGKLAILGQSLLLAFAVFPFFFEIFEFADRRMEKIEKGENKGTGKIKPLAAFFLSFGIIFICWIPVFLAYYPGIMSYDSNRQFSEAYNGIFWELQPILHTLMIRGALLLGEAIGSYERGVAVYSILQMLTLSAALGYAISFVYDLCRKVWHVIALSLFFGIFPVFSVLALCVTKDIFFSAFFLTLSVLAVKRYVKDVKNPLLYDIAMVICGIFMTLFRKNGIYGFALWAVFYILAMKKARIRTLILCVVIIACGIGSIVGLRTIVHGAKGPKTEMYSVPIQQMGHVAFYHRDELTEEEKGAMDYYLQGCMGWESFNISLADAQKSCANPDAWTDTPHMLQDWLYFGLRYPNDYIDAYLGLTAGYWFVDDIAISQYLGYGRENMRGLIETFNASKPMDDAFPGVKSDSRFPAYQYILEGFVSDEWYLKIPVLSVIFRPAVYCWLGAVLYAILLYKKRYRDFAAASLQLAYCCTVALGPVANIRYVFPLMIFLPVLAAFVLFWKGETKEASKGRKG